MTTRTPYRGMNLSHLIAYHTKQATKRGAVPEFHLDAVAYLIDLQGNIEATGGESLNDARPKQES